jgi:hypothetical protein
MTGFTIFDKDNDGYITKSEFHGVAGPKFSFDMLDADGDGKITRAEYEAAFKVYVYTEAAESTAWHAAHLVCMCVCVCIHIHTYKHICIYIYIHDIYI